MDHWQIQWQISQDKRGGILLFWILTIPYVAHISHLCPCMCPCQSRSDPGFSATCVWSSWITAVHPSLCQVWRPSHHIHWQHRSSMKILQRDGCINLLYCTPTHPAAPIHKIHTWSCLLEVWSVYSFSSLHSGSWDQSLLNSGKAHRSLGESKCVYGTEETDAYIW